MHLSPPVASAAVCSKAVVLFLWIVVVWCASHWLWGFCVCLCFVVHYFVSFLVFNHLEEEERALVALLLLSCGCFVTVNVL